MRLLITIPAFNEEKVIRENVLQVLNFCNKNLSVYDYKIVIADNNSHDETAKISKFIAQENEKIDYNYVSQQGKGHAVFHTWLKYIDQADIFIFMDADLATDLSALPDLIRGFEQGYDIVIGSRYLLDSSVKRGGLRKFTSLVYRKLFRIILGSKINDMPCGFKAVNKKVLTKVVPQIKDHGWFFDTELLYKSEKKGYKIKEVPVKWHEPRTQENKSRVNLFKVSWLYLKEIIRLRLSKIDKTN